jgi:polyisoprenoid-binding protein YceI
MAVSGSAVGETLDPNWQQIDPAESSAGFVVKVAWVRNLPGRFDYLEGVIIRQPEQQTLSVDIRLAAQSLWMPNPDHAVWAHSEEFFDSQRHPWIRFHAQNVSEALLTKGGTLTGELSLRGRTRAVDFEVEPAACGRPGVDCPVRANGDLQRSEFGMQARRVVVSDKVRLQLAIKVRAAGSTP